MIQPWNHSQWNYPRWACCREPWWARGALRRYNWSRVSLETVLPPSLPKITSHLGLPQALGCFLLERVEIGRGITTWHLWTITMATVSQVFYFGHCLGAVLPHVLFSNVMSSLVYSFPSALIFQNKVLLLCLSLMPERICPEVSEIRDFSYKYTI